MSSSSSKSRPSRSNGRPFALKLLNAAGRSVGIESGAWIKLDADTLIARAERDTGLSDWGPDEFRPALRQLLRSLNEDSQLNTMGRLMLNDGMRRFLSNRLRMQADWSRHPEILEVRIRKPLFIVGFQRTGSTLLQRLLARDPSARSLQPWEMMQPSPPPRADSYANDPRIAIAERRLKMLDWAAPEFSVAHEVVNGEPEECITLLQNDFMSDAFELMANVPSYHDWLAKQDMHPTYRYYKKELQLLQWQHEKHHWVLKSPYHLLGLQALMDVFPDAVIIQTHREPGKVVPSLCSLYKAMHDLTSDRADSRELGQPVLQRLREAQEIVIEQRRRIGEERFMDVSFREMMADPMGVVRRIYERFGYDLTADAEAAMRSWHAANPQHKRGVHHYSLEQYGLSQTEVDQALSDYTQRFADFL